MQIDKSCFTRYTLSSLIYPAVCVGEWKLLTQSTVATQTQRSSTWKHVDTKTLVNRCLLCFLQPSLLPFYCTSHCLLCALIYSILIPRRLLSLTEFFFHIWLNFFFFLIFSITQRRTMRCFFATVDSKSQPPPFFSSPSVHSASEWQKWL